MSKFNALVFVNVYFQSVELQYQTNYHLLDCASVVIALVETLLLFIWYSWLRLLSWCQWPLLPIRWDLVIISEVSRLSTKYDLQAYVEAKLIQAHCAAMHIWKADIICYFNVNWPSSRKGEGPCPKIRLAWNLARAHASPDQF